MFQSLQFKTIVIIITGYHRLHLHNAYLLHILRMSRFRYSTIALWSISFTCYETTVVSHTHVSKRSQFTMPKKHMLCVIVQDTSSLLLSTRKTS